MLSNQGITSDVKQDLFSQAAGIGQANLFGESPVQPKKKARSAPVTASRTIPLITGGMFELTDTISPERYHAVFNSGMTAYYDLLGLTQTGEPIGVAADLLDPLKIHVLKKYLSSGNLVFIDSGAYTRHKEWRNGNADSPLTDMEQVLGTYDEVLEGLPIDKCCNLSIVMPDVVGDQTWSLRLVEEYCSQILHFIDAGCDVIIPVQRGPLSANETVKQIVRTLGRDDFTIGIPSASAALTLEDAATIRGGRRFHVLGRGTMSMQLFQRSYAVLENNPGARISADANRLRTNLALISHEHSKLIEEYEGQHFTESYDDTELIFEVCSGTSWMSKPEIEALAKFYGVTDKKQVREWIRAHNDEGLQDSIDVLDPEGMMLYQAGLDHVFGVAAVKHLFARLRTDAVATAFTKLREAA